MHDDRHSSDTARRSDAPLPDAFHDAVVDEDPSRWGTRGEMRDAREHQAMRAPDAGTPVATTRSAGWGHPTVAEASVPARPAKAPLAGESDVAHVPARDERVVERERVPRAGVETEAPVDRPRFSLGATFLGWAVAAFFTVVFSAIALGVLGGAQVQDGTIDVGSFAVTTLIGYLVAAFLAYLIGGYAAGRISLWNGTWHGLGTVAWAVAFAAIAVAATTYFADVFDLGALAPNVDLSGLTGAGILAIALSLLAMLAGAALGGRLGERYHEVGDARAWHGREARGHRRRGRPL